GTQPILQSATAPRGRAPPPLGSRGAVLYPPTDLRRRRVAVPLPPMGRAAPSFYLRAAVGAGAHLAVQPLVGGRGARVGARPSQAPHQPGAPPARRPVSTAARASGSAGAGARLLRLLLAAREVREGVVDQLL